MKLFISWSGEESHAVAQVLREELPCIINAVEPFVSSEDIEKGVPWFQSIARELEGSSFGIVCLTSSNLQSKWLHFEAGAIAAKVSQAHVAPLLIGVDETAVKPPFSQFQLTKIEKADFLKLLLTMNHDSKEKPLNEEVLKRSFTIWWPQFEEKVKAARASIPQKQAAQTHRSDRELIEEILSLVRPQAYGALDLLKQQIALADYWNPDEVYSRNDLYSHISPRKTISEKMLYATVLNELWRKASSSAKEKKTEQDSDSEREKK